MKLLTFSNIHTNINVTKPKGRSVYEPYTYIVRTRVPVAWSTLTEIKSAATEWTLPLPLTMLITLTHASATTLWNHPTLGDTMATHPTTEVCWRTQEAVPYSCVILPQPISAGQLTRTGWGRGWLSPAQGLCSHIGQKGVGVSSLGGN